MSNYKISIIIPVFNAEKHLKDSLNSIIDQSIGVENLEVIIVNDASTDSSKSIIDEYCLKYPDFKAVHLTENITLNYGAYCEISTKMQNINRQLFLKKMRTSA